MRDPMKGLDRIIAEAQEEGKFEDLPGKGKPLVIDPSPDAVVKGILKHANVSMAPEWITLACEIDRLLEQEEQLLQSYAAAVEAEQAMLLNSAATVPVAEPGPPSSPKPRRAGWRAAISALFARPLARPTPRRDEALAAFQGRWDLTLERYAALLHEVNRKIRRFNPIVPMDSRQRALLPLRERLEAFVDRFPRLARAEDGTVRPERGHIPASLLAPPEADESARPKRDVLQTAALLQLRQGGRKPPPIG
jgi:Domain of unknown function (DUF1992)